MTKDCNHLFVDGQQDGERGRFCLHCSDPAPVFRIDYRASDGFKKYAIFSELGDARDYAQTWIGKRSGSAGTYAVSEDGVSVVTVTGWRMQ